MNIANERFQNGLTAPNKYPTFAATGASGDLVVEGEQTATGVEQAQINAAKGGKILLIAPNVTNRGKITAPDGQVILAAGNSIYLSNPNSSDLSMRGLWVEINNDATLPGGAVKECRHQRQAGHDQRRPLATRPSLAMR